MLLSNHSLKAQIIQDHQQQKDETVISVPQELLKAFSAQARQQERIMPGDQCHEANPTEQDQRPWLQHA